MSGNIQDTKVDVVRKQVNDLLNELFHMKESNIPIDNDVKDELKSKYKKLVKTSETLFKFIVSNYGTEKFNQTFFNKTLEMMLDRITNIQNSSMTQDNASIAIGQHLANNFIPQLKK